MDQLQNTLKDVDMQIVYQRLEARKKNITKDGILSKKQLASAYRGYHGLESQYHALQHMSNTALVHTKRKNDQVHLAHVEDMKTIIEQEKKRAGRADKDIQTLRDDFTTQLAYQYVYKNHSFKKYDVPQTPKKARPASDRPPDLFIKEREAAHKIKVTRPLGSVRQLQEYRDELKMKFPPIKEPDGSNETKSKVNMMGNKPPVEQKDKNTAALKEVTSFPNIEGAMGVEVKFRFKMKDDEKGSLYSAPAGQMEVPGEAYEDAIYHKHAFDMGQNLLQMRQAEKDKIEKRRLLPSPPKSKAETKKEAWRRILPQTPNRNSTIFPKNTKNAIGVKKMVRKEVSEVKDNWANSTRRQELVEKVKELEKEKQAEMQMPFPVFDRSRPTSAILRDYEEYKQQKEMWMERHKDGESGPDSIIIRQLSPQPRAGSPVSQRRNEYSSRINTPVPKRESSNLLARASKLRRTDSEKFPSVSRTSSYKDLPDVSPEIKENALLTAAQRIEKEKQRRESANQPRQKVEAKENVKSERIIPKIANEQPSKRRLPQPPRKEERKLDRARIPDNRMETTVIGHNKMFDTSILAIDKDTKMIHSVRDANATEEISTEISKPEGNPNDKTEHGPNNENKCVPNDEHKLVPFDENEHIPNDDNECISNNNNEHVPNDKTVKPLRQAVVDHDNQLERKATYINVSGNESPRNSAKPPPVPSTPLSREYDSYTPLAMQADPPPTPTHDVRSTLTRVNSLTGKYIQIRQRKMNYSHENYSRTTETKKQMELRAKNRRKVQLKNAKLAEESCKGTEKDRPPTRVSFNENVIVFQTI